MKRILITGGSGMLGFCLVKELEKDFEVYSTGNSQYCSHVTRYLKFDLLSDSYKKLIDWSRPDIIIHCAALTDGTYCEKNPHEAYKVNGLSMKKIIDATKKKVKIIYISSDAVFPSTLNLAKEIDCVSPENIYGKSKELGEYFLKTSKNIEYLIIRTTIVGLNFNNNKTSFIDWIIRTSIKNQKLGLFNDVLFSPITIWDLSNEIKFLLNSNNINSEILHISGEMCTKYEFGKSLLKSLNISTLNLFENSILTFSQRFNRSTDQTLDSSFYEKKYSRILPKLNQTINNLKKHYNGQN